MLYDVDAESTPIVSCRAAAGEPLDLSMSTLRAHSLMHIEYLKNMGVRATMTISLLRDGILWGLVSCHHKSPYNIGSELRTTAELFAQMISFLIEKRERDELATYEEHTRLIHRQLINGIIEDGPVGQNLATMADRLAELIPSDGLALCINGSITLKGITPTHEEVAALRNFLDRIVSGQIYSTDALGIVYPAGQDFDMHAAGILVIPISRSPRDYCAFFRQEVIRTVTWAGFPNKVLTTGPDGVRVSPRKSFEAWRETMRGHSAPWSALELRVAETLRVTMLEVILHFTGKAEQENRLATSKQELLIAELNHRVRNILGLIRGLVAQSRTSAVDIDTFASVLGDRVHALARAHDKITAKNWGPGSLATLIATEAGAYLGLGADRITATGPAVMLVPQAFSTITLVIHELVTNAAKYGALSGPHGKVSIAWSLDPTGGVAIEWNETNGPVVQAPMRRGFGMTIVERSIPHELGGVATLNFSPTGLQARFVLPKHYIVLGDAIVIPRDIIMPVAAILASPGLLAGAVLLVEDNLLIALDAEDILMKLGADHINTAANVSEAFRQIDLERPTFALLDVNLGTETTWLVATRLRELGVPHAFATGYDNQSGYPIEHRQTPSITKPYSAEAIAQVVSDAFLRGSRNH